MIRWQTEQQLVANRAYRRNIGNDEIFTKQAVPIPAAVLVFALVISVAMYIAYVQVQTMTLRNAMKTGLANLAVTISEDTYKADILKAVKLSTDEYKIESIKLDFTLDGKRIRYVCTCDVSFQISILGINVPAVARSVQVEGSHTAKYRVAFQL